MMMMIELLVFYALTQVREAASLYCTTLYTPSARSRRVLPKVRRVSENTLAHVTLRGILAALAAFAAAGRIPLAPTEMVHLTDPAHRLRHVLQDSGGGNGAVPA